MARRVRASTLENRTARLKLEPRKKPYHFTIIAPGIAVGYRRNEGPGKWVLRAADGHGAYWTDAIALADDHEPADGATVCTFWQAQDKARVLVRGEDAAGDRPATVADALDAYERDLATRDGAAINARGVRKLITAALLAKPVGLLTFRSCATGATVCSTTRKASTVNSHVQVAQGRAQSGRRPRSAHRQRRGVAARPGEPARRPHRSPCRTARARRAQASSAPPMRSPRQLGLWTEVAATTGARPSQIARLDVADLQDDRDDPRLMMPSVAKGRGRKRVERRPVPIPPAWRPSCGRGRRQAARRSVADPG